MKGILNPSKNRIEIEARSTYMLPKSYIKLKIAFNFNSRR